MKTLLSSLLLAFFMADCLMAQSIGANNSPGYSDRLANKVTISIAGATPSVATGNIFVTANGSLTTITNFIGGVDNQSITVICGDAHTTIANNSNIVTASGNNIACTRNLMNVFVYYVANAQWVQASVGSINGGGTPGHSNLQLQSDKSSPFAGTSLIQKPFRGANLFEPHESTTFCGPEPWSDVVCYGWYATYSASTGTISSGSNSLSLPGGAAHFQNGEYLVVYGAGAAPIVTAPTGVTVLPSVNAGGTIATVPITSGPKTYCYSVVTEGLNNDYSAASRAACTSNGQTLLGPQTATIISQTLSNQTVTVTCASACALPTGSGGAHVYIQLFSTTGPVQFEGWFTAIGVDSTHFTYMQTGFDSRDGAPTSSTGGKVWWWNTNHITWSYQSSAKAYHIYGPSCPTTCIWIGETTIPSFNDYGTSPNPNLSVISGFPALSNYMEYGNTRPAWMPSAAPSSSGNQMLSCKIGFGGGTTRLTLVTSNGSSCTAGASVTNATTLSDDGPTLVQAQANSVVDNASSVSTGAVFVPGNMSASVPNYTYVNSYTNLSSHCTTFYLNGTYILSNNTINLGCSTITSWSGSATGAFGWGSWSSIGTPGNAYPLFLNPSNLSHLNVTCLAINGCLLMDFTTSTDFHTDNTFFQTNNGSGGDYTGQIQLIHSGGFGYRYGPYVTFVCGAVSNPPAFNDQGIDPLVCNTFTADSAGTTPSGNFFINGPVWTLFRAGFDQDWSRFTGGGNFIVANDIETQSMTVPLFVDTAVPTSSGLCGGIYLTNITQADRSTPIYAALGNTGCNVYIANSATGVGSHPIISGNVIAGSVQINDFPANPQQGNALITTYGSVMDGMRANNATPHGFLADTENVILGGELALQPTSNLFVENLPPPAPTCAPRSTGGTISNGTYYFTFVPVYQSAGEGVRSLVLTCPLSAGTSTQSVVVNWTAKNTAGAIGYNLYWSNGGGYNRINSTVISRTAFTYTFTGAASGGGLGSYPGAGPVQVSASGISAPIGRFYNSLEIGDQGSCAMTAGTCSLQKLSRTYTAPPNCVATWNGTGVLTGLLKVSATTTTVTPASSVATDSAVVNWVCFGN
jgi:hypothetical protein